MATTTVTVKGQVTLPKEIRDAAGIKAGDRLKVEATASGGVYIEKPGSAAKYRKRLQALAKRRIMKVPATDAYMKQIRGDPDEDYSR
ncbi:MAG TPA: AbrB/MazE/SpoVT family DNA-binding domain-containing protein [Xanthobacteraceae bacterium]|nr:AbrB/MazE/SpoVT family DNA-binding domain-containing protein [Xanthobacteraceae bacterium]